MTTAWGVHAARGAAMVGMTIAHFVDRDGSGTGLDLVRPAVDGRAMALFVLLAGVGISLLTSRSPAPDAALLARGAVLLVIGVILTAIVARIAVVLDEYALFFLVAVGLRRLPDRVLLVGAAGAIGASWLTIQWLGRDYGTDWPAGPVLVERYLFTGYYPLLPTVGYLMVGLWLGRQDLFDASLLARALAVGVGLVAVADLGTRWVDRAWTMDPTARADGQILGAAAFDTTGHSGMPAATIGALGTALVVLAALSLLANVRAGPLAGLIGIGRIALTFYVAQAVLSDHVPYADLSIAQEYLVVAAILGVTAVLAQVVLAEFGRGPLEALLRSISRRAEGRAGGHRHDRGAVGASPSE